MDGMAYNPINLNPTISCFQVMLPPPRPLPKPKLREPDAVLLVPCQGFWWMRGVYGTGSTCTSLMLFFFPWEIEGLWWDYDYMIAMIGMFGWIDSCDGFDGSKSEGDDIVQFASSFNKKMASNWWFHFVLQLIARSARWSLFPAPKIGEQWSAATNIFPEKNLLGRWNSF